MASQVDVEAKLGIATGIAVGIKLPFEEFDLPVVETRLGFYKV